MGFAFTYRSMRPVSPAEGIAIRAAARDANRGRSRLGCEPVHFVADDEDHLAGSSKPNIMPHPGDAVATARSGLPDGTSRDLLDILCGLSRDHGVDWEIGHDDIDGPVGYIRDGECDEDVAAHLEAFAELGDMLIGRKSDDDFAAPPAPRDKNSRDDEDGGGPVILAFRPRGS